MHRNHPVARATLVEQAYWDTAYANMSPGIAPADDRVRQWLEAEIARVNGDKHCLEVGCFPGRYLSVIGKLGYVVHGVDLAPAIERMPKALRAQGVQTGNFEHVDFLTHRFDRTYDLVCSFGFIEHFTQWREVLLKHAALVGPDGLLVLETPNFRGWVQQIFHRWLDRTNTRRHYLPAMSPGEWADMLKPQGFEVITNGYLGKFDFWADTPITTTWQRLGYQILALTRPILKRMGNDRSSIAPYCVLIARRVRANKPL